MQLRQLSICFDGLIKHRFFHVWSTIIMLFTYLRDVTDSKYRILWAEKYQNAPHTIVTIGINFSILTLTKSPFFWHNERKLVSILSDCWRTNILLMNWVTFSSAVYSCYMKRLDVLDVSCGPHKNFYSFYFGQLFLSAAVVTSFILVARYCHICFIPSNISN